MQKYFALPLATLSFLVMLGLLPSTASAQSIELQRVFPEVDENITPPDNQKGAEENFYTFWFKGQIGTEYGAAFTVSEEPAFTFVSGGNMTLEDNIHYDPDTHTFSVTYTAEALEQIDSQSSLELDEGQTLTIIAISFPVAEGESGPGEATIGSWISTNFQEWTLITPNEENNMLGAEVSGDAGDEGQFKMFIPQVSLDAMAVNDHAEVDEYTAEDFAMYQDNTFTTEDITSVTGGALLNFAAVIPEETGSEEGEEEQAPAAQSGSGSSVLIEVGPKDNVTILSDKQEVKEGRFVTFTGWLKSGKKGKTVTLLRRTEDTAFAPVATAVTTKNGKFTFTLKVWEASAFKAKFKTKKSQALQITIK